MSGFYTFRLATLSTSWYMNRKIPRKKSGQAMNKCGLICYVFIGFDFMPINYNTFTVLYTTFYRIFNSTLSLIFFCKSIRLILPGFVLIIPLTICKYWLFLFWELFLHIHKCYREECLFGCLYSLQCIKNLVFHQGS